MNTIKLVNKKGRMAFLIVSGLALLLLAICIFLLANNRSGNNTIEQQKTIDSLIHVNEQLKSSNATESSFIKLNQDTLIEVHKQTKDTVTFKRIPSAIH